MICHHFQQSSFINTRLFLKIGDKIIKTTLKRNSFPFLFGIGVISVSCLVSSCSNGNKLGEPIQFKEDTPRTGFFSGKKGGFYIFKGSNTENINTTINNKIQTKAINEMSFKEASEKLAERISRLEKDKIELELLKKQIDKKLIE